VSDEPAGELAERLAETYERLDLRPRDLLTIDRTRATSCPNRYWAEEALPRAAALVAAVVELLDQGRPAVSDPKAPLDRLGPPVPIRHVSTWWHRRLRRAAIATSIPSILLAAPVDAELIVARKEMDLLARSPWSHADRLLSAFELAHIEIRHRILGEPVNTPAFFRQTGFRHTSFQDTGLRHA
jgi:hypothetical protein